MANLTFATVKIATKEEMDNTFVIDFFRSINPEKTSYIRGYEFPEERDYVIINYTPSFNFDIYDLVEELSKHFPHTFSTIGHSYGNMQPTTVEYIVAYKNGEVIFEEKYPYVIFEEEGEMDDEGGYPIDKEATKDIRNKLEADKKEWFPTLYQKSEHLNSVGENIVWRPSSEEVAKEPSEKLTEKEKRLLSSMLEYLQIIGFVDVDGEEEDGLDEEELEARTTQRIQTIKDKILGKDYSSND